MQFLTNFLCKLFGHKYVTKAHSVIQDGAVETYFPGLFAVDDNSLMFGDIRCSRCDKKSEDTRDYLIL